METLLTLKQVQDILQVDRTTIHRMLKDGRLAGVKVGGQWRFSRQQIETLTQGAVCEEEEWGEEILPVYCVQRMQDVFAEIAGVGAVVTDLQGTPLTRMSNRCAFCALVQSSPSGQAACQQSWREMGTREARGEVAGFLQCHAGLQYARARISVDGTSIATIVSGQFHASPADQAMFIENLPQLSARHNLPLQPLQAAAANIPLLSPKYQGQIAEWLQKMAATFSDVSSERAHLLGRLRQIAEITLDVEGGTLSKLAR